jgi:hypothetical protein
MVGKGKGRVLFDVAGVVVVAAWAVSLCYYSYGSAVSGPTAAPIQDGPGLLREGETWMLILSANADEVGYTHEVRTRVNDGWIFEYDVFAAMTFGGAQLILESDVKAILDAEQYLVRANATLTSPAGDLEVIVIARGNQVELIVDTGSGRKTSVVDLGTRPQLGNQVLARLIAADGLEPGGIYQDVYFDPIAMKQKPMKLTYIGLKELDLVGSVAMCHHVKQSLEDGTELDVYIDDHGELCIQEFPMKMLASRMEPKFGATRSRSLRKKKLSESKKKELGKLPLAEVVSVAQGFARSVDKERRSRMRIVGAGDPTHLHLLATNYRVIQADDTGILVELGSQPAVHRSANRELEIDKPVEHPTAEFVASLSREIEAAVGARLPLESQVRNALEEWSRRLVKELPSGAARLVWGVRFNEGTTEEAVWVQVDCGDGVVDFYPPSQQGGDWLQLSNERASPAFAGVKVVEISSSGE